MAAAPALSRTLAIAAGPGRGYSRYRIQSHTAFGAGEIQEVAMASIADTIGGLIITLIEYR